jgi:signal transduction histidine kinase/ligand-binding sensor domain-containing protein
MRLVRSRGIRGRRVCGVAVAVAFLLCGSSASALNPAFDVSQYAHRSWKLRDGFAKAVIHAMAQTPDGYLWLGTEFGLLRFDGVRSTPWHPPGGQRLPSDEIYGLLAARDGTLWIATARGLARWKDATLTHVEQLAGEIVMPLLESRDGTIWAGTIAVGNARICEIQRAHVECHRRDQFGTVIVDLHEDRSGGIWASVVDGVWHWKPGPPRFHPMPGSRDNMRAFVDYQDHLLVGTTQGLRRLTGGKAGAYQIPGMASPVEVRALLRDRDDGLWIGTARHGLVHIHEGRSDVFRVNDGLSGDRINALFEDREGNIWVSTEHGFDRFRDVAVPTFGARQGASDAPVGPLLAARDGSLWFAASRVLYHYQAKRSSSTILPTATGQAVRKPIGVPNAILEDPGGRIWVTTLDGLGYFENGRFQLQRDITTGVVHAMASDTAGTIWIANQKDGLIQVSSGGVTKRSPWTTFGGNDFATALAADPQGGGVWVGFQHGGVLRFDGDDVRASYTATDGLGAGRINTLRFDRHGALWAATAGGLSRLNAGRLATLSSTNGLPCDAVHWEMADDAQAIWLYMPCGLVRIPVSDLEAWAASTDTGQGTRKVSATLFDGSDGVGMSAIPSSSSPSVTKSTDGRIWYGSPNGISLIDPPRMRRNNLPPPVHIEQITADRIAIEASAGSTLTLPALTRHLQIDYTGLSFVAPEKVRFRYRLDNHDRDWQDVGDRRQAYYNDLPPGNYRFRVIAANDSGVWNDTGATLAFAIAPAYYQTTWFLTLSIGAVLALFWGAHRVRVRVVEKHQRQISALNERLMKAQEQERIRIAGELHDGVMQQMLAVTMMLGTAKRRMGADADAKATIDKIQDKMVRLGTDLRRVSHDLHPPALQEAGLPGALRLYCDEFQASSGISVACEVDETVTHLSRGAALALFRIAQEAIGNAAKHAAATHIAVRVRRSGDDLSLEVADDGVGFDQARLGRSGGLGLITMRERAGQLHGTFDIETSPGGGTTVRATIPFR